MIDRLKQEHIEEKNLSPLAAKSINSKRQKFESKCPIRTEFQRDKDRIIHSKAFRRLMHKTQVFLFAEGDHYRTRLTHTLEVSQIARTIARALLLNEDLTEAISLGHDLGHTPFGHTGESVLNQIHKDGFKHNVQSLRVVDILENAHGKEGLNLTNEVRDGILNHTGNGTPYTLEGQIVKISDRIAYINHDIDDAIRNGVLQLSDLPKECIMILGDTHSKRINTLVADMIKNGEARQVISLSEEISKNMNELRNYMFTNVYFNDQVKNKDELNKAENIIKYLYNYFINLPTGLPSEQYELINTFGVNVIVKDYIAGMTDRYAINKYEETCEKTFSH